MNGSTVLKSETTKAIISSGVSFIYLSYSDFLLFFDQLLEIDSSVACSTGYCWTTDVDKECGSYYDTLPSIEIKIDDTTYQVPPSAYVLAGLNDQKCLIGVGAVDDSLQAYLLGNVFLRSFYSVYDFSNLSVGLAVSTNAPAGTKIGESGIKKPDEKKDDEITKKQEQEQEEKRMMIVVSSAVTSMILLVLLLVCWFRSRTHS